VWIAIYGAALRFYAKNKKTWLLFLNVIFMSRKIIRNSNFLDIFAKETYGFV